MRASAEAVRDFWQDHPVETRFNPEQEGSPAFFDAQRAFRYGHQPHIAQAAGFESMRGQDVLEIGCGVGTDAVEISRAGARYTGVDVTSHAVELTRRHLAYRGVSGHVELASATALPFGDATMDLVYSHGVLHHVPDIDRAVREVHRVLRPGGRAVVMLYHRHSLNYYIDILGVRRALALLLWLPGMARLAARVTGEGSVIQGHRANLERYGLSYLSATRFLDHNTDGPDNPLSRVFSRAEAERLFQQFARVETRVYFLNLRWMMRFPPFAWLPASSRTRLGRRWGWHLWIYATK